MISSTVPCVDDKDSVRFGVRSAQHTTSSAGMRGELGHTITAESTDLVACHNLHSDALQGGCSRFAYGTCVGKRLCPCEPVWLLLASRNESQMIHQNSIYVNLQCFL